METAPKLTLLVLADASNEEGAAWPKLSRMADLTGLTVFEVRQALATLQADKLISISRQNLRGVGTPNVYRLNTAVIDERAKSGRSA